MLTQLTVERLLADAEAERRRQRRHAELVRHALSARRSRKPSLRVRLGHALIRTGEALAAQG